MIDTTTVHHCPPTVHPPALFPPPSALQTGVLSAKFRGADPIWFKIHRAGAYMHVSSLPRPHSIHSMHVGRFNATRPLECHLDNCVLCFLVDGNLPGVPTARMSNCPYRAHTLCAVTVLPKPGPYTLCCDCAAQNGPMHFFRSRLPSWLLCFQFGGNLPMATKTAFPVVHLALTLFVFSPWGSRFDARRAANMLGLVVGFVGLGIIVTAYNTSSRKHFVSRTLRLCP